MTSSYEKIYSCFLGKITDYSFVEMDENDAFDIMNERMKSVVSEPYIRRLFSSILFDDYEEVVEFELKNGVDESADADFVTEIFGRGMVIAWLEQQVKSVLYTAQKFGGKEQKFYSQAQHLSELQNMLKSTKTELRRMICDYGYINNPYIRGE